MKVVSYQQHLDDKYTHHSHFLFDLYFHTNLLLKLRLIGTGIIIFPFLFYPIILIK